MPRHGIIADAARESAALAAGADYIEPTIAGNVAVRTEHGGWELNPHYAGRRHPSFAILVPGDVGLSDPAFPRDEVRAYFAAVLPIVGSVAEHDATIVFGSGAARRIPDGVAKEDGEAAFAEALRIARDLGEQNGLRITLEPLNSGETNLVNSIAEAVDFLDRHGIDRVPIVADLWHIRLEDEPFAVLHEHAARIGHAHVCGSGRRALADDDWPWPEFVRELRAAGYAGPLTLECGWGDDAEREMAESVKGLARVDAG
jgi:D-psicose/D-tagatose/L-ribulose 3-epimerase